MDVLSHSVMSDCVTPWTAACQTLSMGILQARILEWVAMAFSRGSSQPRNQILLCWQILYCLSHQGSPTVGKPETNNQVHNIFAIMKFQETDKNFGHSLQVNTYMDIDIEFNIRKPLYGLIS